MAIIGIIIHNAIGSITNTNNNAATIVQNILF